MSLPLNVLTAFGAGLLSFLSPCVLPLVPGYISFVSGLSLQELTAADGRPTLLRKTLSGAGLFVLGFSLVFTLLGASASVIGAFLQDHLRTLAKIRREPDAIILPAQLKILPEIEDLYPHRLGNFFNLPLVLRDDIHIARSREPLLHPRPARRARRSSRD